MTLHDLELQLRLVYDVRPDVPRALLAPVLRGNYSLRSLLRAVAGARCQLVALPPLVAKGRRRAATVVVEGLPEGELPLWTVADLGDALHRERVARGLSISDVERLAGLTAAQIMRIEKGRGCQKKTLERYLQCVEADVVLRR